MAISRVLARSSIAAALRVQTRAFASKIDVASYVKKNMTRYEGDASFLAGPTQKTLKVWHRCEELMVQEIKQNGLLELDNKIPSTITAFGPGYIDKENEVIVGVQTDKPLKRAIKPIGGVHMVKDALHAYKSKLDPKVEEIYTKFRKTHNQGVFDAYTPEMRLARSVGILTGLPDAYGRGRIIGDYRRVALYGVDALIAAKQKSHNQGSYTDEEWASGNCPMTEERIRVTEELAEQIRALKELKEMAKTYGVDLAKPAKNAQEAVQFTYMAYLAAVKEQDGAAMSMGRIDAFLDTYFEKDLANGTLTEEGAQEIIDQFIIKCRLVRHLRPPSYNALFAGDPVWVTMVLGGIAQDGTHMVTKTAYRILRTLENLGPAPEPNITVLWHENLPKTFKDYCARLSILTSSIQYESDALMNCRYGSDYGIACCVSAMTIGKDMQFFGARCNLGKLLLYVINGGIDEVEDCQVGPKHLFPALSTAGKKGQDAQPLKYEEVRARYSVAMAWLAQLYANTMNVIHFMHDKYNYERIQMALHDDHVRRLLAFGIAGLSVVADSLSAIKYAKVYPIRNEKGIATDFKVVGEFPKYGNDDDAVDQIAKKVTEEFSKNLRSHPTYRKSVPTLSVLTITSNVVYGQKTGSTPDGRKAGEAFAPGANPMHGRDTHGCLASLNSVAKIPYESCLDGVSNTFSIVPASLGKTESDKENNLTSILDGYFKTGGFHLNVNVLNRETLVDAMNHPEKYPSLTIRVSGYAVHFVKLTRAQQQEVISRTFHETM